MIMDKKQKQQTKTCADCIHEFACSMWNMGTLHWSDATNCTNYETVLYSSAYLCGVLDERNRKQTNADRIRAMSDEELAKFLAEIEYRRSGFGGGAKWKDADHALIWLQQPEEGE